MPVYRVLPQRALQTHEVKCNGVSHIICIMAILWRCISKISTLLNKIAQQHNNKRTMHCYIIFVYLTFLVLHKKQESFPHLQQNVQKTLTTNTRQICFAYESLELSNLSDSICKTIHSYTQDYINHFHCFPVVLCCFPMFLCSFFFHIAFISLHFSLHLSLFTPPKSYLIIFTLLKSLHICLGTNRLQ